MNNTILNLTRQLSELTDGELWIDETFLKKLTGLTEEQAFTRPYPSVHSVAEIVSHLLEWRISVLSILQGGSRTLTMGSPSDWKNNATLRQEGWPVLKEKFYKSQQDIIAFLSRQQDDYLLQVDSKENHTYLYYTEGLIHHDIYHLGQIGLVIKMLTTT
ncbi:MAG: DinB family protein [Chitinophagaceae bacterium]|nr:DinB family protein [Chitinophagaceae bacterium]